MRLGDRAHDRQSQAGAAAAALLLTAAEALERPRKQLGREAATLVGDAQLDVLARAPDGDGHRARAVAERVVDQVPERLLEPQRIGLGEQRIVRPHGDQGAAELLRAPREAAAHALGDLDDVGRHAPEHEPAPVGGGDQQQRAREGDEPVGLLAGGADRRPQLLLALGVVERVVELGPHQRERGAQLVPRLRYEGPLALDRPLEAAEHLVERVAERLQLVARRRDGQPLPWRVGGDLRRARAHGLDRAQAGTGQAVTEGGREQERERADHEQLVAQAPQRLAAVLGRRADDEDEPPAAAADRRREQPDSLVEPRDLRQVEERAMAPRGAQLRPREQRPGAQRRGGVEHPAVGCEQLRERLPALDQARGRLRRQRPARRAGERREVLGAHAQVAVERPCEVVAQARVEHDAGRRQHQRHGHGEPRGHPQPDRHARAHERRTR